MRKHVLSTLFLVASCLLLFPQEAKAQWAYGASGIGYDSATRIVYGYSRTSVDYYAGAYYDPYVEGYLYGPYGVHDAGSARGYESYYPAMVDTDSYTTPSTQYVVISDHYVISWYSVTVEICSFYGFFGGCGYDPYGYSLFGPGNYGGFNYFYSPGYGGYVQQRTYYLGSTGIGGTTPPDDPCGASPSGVMNSPPRDAVMFANNCEPPPTVRITSPRASGYIEGTTQNALLGADVILQASPSSPGGTYSWTFGGPAEVSGGATNSSAVTIRSTDLSARAGNITATVTYTLNGRSGSASVTINSTLPTLKSYTGTQGADIIGGRRTGCNSGQLFTYYQLGCSPPQNPGMLFSTTVEAPATYISDPAQSGLKYVQAISTVRKRLRDGDVQCVTARTAEDNVGSGWQLDGSDPYNPDVDAEPPTRRFSDGSSLVIETVDYPARAITGIGNYQTSDAAFIDERFETYVYYFAGSNPAAPVREQPLGRLAWRWGGQVVFDSRSASSFTQQFTFQPPRSHTGAAMSINDSTVPFRNRGTIQERQYARCPSGPDPIINAIDSSPRFVEWHYRDFFGREHNAYGEDGGLEFWWSHITRCAFDTACIDNERVNVSRSFWYSGEFLGRYPGLRNPPGVSPDFNNAEFVRLCYKIYLQRNPGEGRDAGSMDGYNFWLNHLNRTNDYNLVIRGFITSPEYRERDRPFIRIPGRIISP